MAENQDASAAARHAAEEAAQQHAAEALRVSVFEAFRRRDVVGYADLLQEFAKSTGENILLRQLRTRRWISELSQDRPSISAWIAASA